MTLKVYCTGFSRTGTKSFKEALEILAYPCFHMVEIIDKKAVDPTRFTASLYFYKEIIDHYPDAKIIHTDRDPDKWYDSVKDTIWVLSRLGTSPPYSWFTPSQVRKARAMTDEFWSVAFPDGFLNKEASKEVMQQHKQKVLDYKGADNVLVFQVQEGWEPLCKFLGVPVPNVPFPKTNDTNAIKPRISELRTAERIFNGVFWALVAAGVAFVYNRYVRH